MLNPARRPGYRNKVGELDLLDRIPLVQALSGLRDQIEITLIRDRKSLEKFRDFIANCHYLGYQQPTGEHLKYPAYYQNRPIACLSFGCGSCLFVHGHFTRLFVRRNDAIHRLSGSQQFCRFPLDQSLLFPGNLLLVLSVFCICDSSGNRISESHANALC